VSAIFCADEALIRSGHKENYEAGKDTGRFWIPERRMVHWVIVGEDQVEDGIKRSFVASKKLKA